VVRQTTSEDFHLTDSVRSQAHHVAPLALGDYVRFVGTHAEYDKIVTDRVELDQQLFGVGMHAY